MEFKVIKKGNGKFYPRMFLPYGGPHGLWYREPSEFDNLEDAKKALIDWRAKCMEEERLNKEEVVFELK